MRLHKRSTTCAPPLPPRACKPATVLAVDRQPNSLHSRESIVETRAKQSRACSPVAQATRPACARAGCKVKTLPTCANWSMTGQRACTTPAKRLEAASKTTGAKPCMHVITAEHRAHLCSLRRSNRGCANVPRRVPRRYLPAHHSRVNVCVHHTSKTP